MPLYRTLLLLLSLTLCLASTAAAAPMTLWDPKHQLAIGAHIGPFKVVAISKGPTSPVKLHAGWVLPGCKTPTRGECPAKDQFQQPNEFRASLTKFLKDAGYLKD
jgi:hypothetical protein